MALSSINKAALKAAILAETDPELVGYRTNGQAQKIADWYNTVKADGAFAWDSSVLPINIDEITPWVDFDSLTAGKRDSWRQFLVFSHDFRQNRVRKWVTDVWGNATNPSNAYTLLTGAGMRKVTRAEAVIGGTATTSTNAATAIKLAWEGFLSEADISEVLA